MRRFAYGNHGSTVIRRRLQQRFGIAAQKVAIRREWPLFLRIALWGGILSLTIAVSAWMYDSGRRYAGFDSSETEREMARLREVVVALEAELSGLRTVAHTSDSRLQLEVTTQDQLVTQLRSLQRENAVLREDLALFEGLVTGGIGDAGIKIGRASIEPSRKPGRWNYSVLVVNSGGAKTGKEIQGGLQFELIARQNGRDVTIFVPQGEDALTTRIPFAVKYFRRLDGGFSLPEGVTLKSGEIRLIQEGVVKARLLVDVKGA